MQSIMIEGLGFFLLKIISFFIVETKINIKLYDYNNITILAYLYIILDAEVQSECLV